MASLFATPPESLCVLRLSALGDVAHMVPIIRTLSAQLPETRLSWILGKGEEKLLHGLPGVEMIVFDKNRGIRAYYDIYRQLRNRQFDGLLVMQLALRANLLALLVRSPLKLGYDTGRSREMHGLFINRRIHAGPAFHVQEVFFSFLETLGIQERVMEWNIPIPAKDIERAETLLPGNDPTLLINPCSRHRLRNWHVRGYVEVAQHAVTAHGLRVALIGGSTALEREYADGILAQAGVPVIDLVGKDTLKTLLALIRKACVVVTPDSAPAHFASAAGVAVIGLHAATSSRRSGPYRSLDHCVDKFEEAALRFLGRPASALRWGTRIEVPGVMDLISASEVKQKLDRIMEKGAQDASGFAR